MKKFYSLSIMALVFATTAAFGTTSCIRLRNSAEQETTDLGRVVTKNYNLSGFDKLDLSGVGNIYITQGKAYSVKVSAQEKLFERITVDTDGSELTVDLSQNNIKKGFSFGNNNNARPKDISVFITMPTLKSIDQSGVVNVQIEQPMTVDALSIDVSGMGNTHINGLVANKLTADVSGVGNVKIEKLTAKESMFDVSGVGNVAVEYLNSGTSTVQASGVGSVKLTGTLRKLHADKSDIVTKVSNKTQLIK